MGNYKFRLSDMLPNAWFYKLKDMGSSRTRKHRNTNTTPPPPQFMRKNSINSNFSSSSSSASKKKPHLHIGLDLAYPYSFTPDYNTLDKLYASPINQKASDTHFPDHIHLQQARISSKSKRRPKRKTVYRPSPTLVSSSNRNRPASPILFPDDLLFSSINSSPDITSIRNAAAAASPPPPPPPNDHHSFNEPSSCNCRISSSTADIIIDVNDDDEEEDDASITRKDENLVGFDIISEIGLLPPILTKPVKTATTKPNYPLAKKKSSARSTTGVKLSRSNSPKISSRRINSNNNSNQGQARKSVKSKNRRSKVFSESFAIVKSSVDPQRDFRESMVEMIVENNIRASKDLEDLLACYLTLNSDQYHDLIVKAFEQIWFDMADLAI